MMSQLYNDMIFTLDKVLNNNKCNNIIKRANLKGWNESSTSGGGHGRTEIEDPRTNKFCVFPEHIDYRVKRNIKDFQGEWERLFETSCKNYAD